jgi:hypothetical protein
MIALGYSCSNDCLWPFSAAHGDEVCWSNPMQSLVKANANDWSGRMQAGGQVDCNFASAACRNISIFIKFSQGHHLQMTVVSHSVSHRMFIDAVQA